MNVVDLHPEELFDKEEAGTLTEAERARLDAHVAKCETCRLERTLRADFAAELEEDVPVAPAPEPVVPRRVPTRARRARGILLVAAAAIAVVGVAAASETSGGRWIRRVVGVDPTETDPGPELGRRERVAPGAPPAPPPEAETAPPPVAPPEEVAEPAPADPAPAIAPTVFPVAPPAKPSPKVEDAPAETAASLLEEANLARRRGEYARAITLARKLQATHPESREAHLSRATLGRLLLDTGDPAGALASFDAYLARRGGELDEPVMVGRAMALDRLGRTEDAQKAWAALLQAFPTSPYAEHARGRIGTSGAAP